MNFTLRKWRLSDAKDLAAALNNEKKLNKLRDGLPFPYTEQDGDRLVGVLCMRAPQHIGDFFVEAAYHRRGISRQLFEAMRRDYSRQVFTVNSSPYAVEVYRHLGFVPTDTEQLTDGIRYTPMLFTEGEQ